MSDGVKAPHHNNLENNIFQVKNETVMSPSPASSVLHD